MDQNKRIFKNHNNAVIRASEIATEKNAIMVVGMHCETSEYHIMEKDDPKLMETTTDEMDGEEVEIETFINCWNIHPNKKK